MILRCIKVWQRPGSGMPDDLVAPNSYRLIIDNFRMINQATPHSLPATTPRGPIRRKAEVPVQETRTKGLGNTAGGREVPISRRQFVSTAAGAGIASVVAPRVTIAQNSGSIRIGLLAAKTGPLHSDGTRHALAL